MSRTPCWRRRKKNRQCTWRKPQGPVSVCEGSCASYAKGGGGAIVNLASVVAIRSEPNFGAHCESKAGVLRLTRSMVVEWSPLRIRVNSVLPGSVDTPMKWRWVHPDDVDAVREAAASLVPLGRMADPAEIAQRCLGFVARLPPLLQGVF
jgi:NAD(P)-dependent dehydrogenase (short-subunit alcohol dehydrogenase family)